MRYKIFTLPLLALGITAAAQMEAKEEKAGIVNFATCVTESKYGKQEQEAFESIKKQMGAYIEDTEKQLKEVANKLNDSDHMDGLSPEGTQELNAKFQALQEEMYRYQQQYNQLMSQAQYQLIQKINGYIQSASRSIAQKKKLDYVMNKEAVFFYHVDLDITNDVIAEMNKDFDKNQKNQSNENQTSIKQGD